jgi:hypothetical protein
MMDLHAWMLKIRDTDDETGVMEACYHAAQAKWNFLSSKFAYEDRSMIAGFIFAIVGYHRGLDFSQIAWPPRDEVEAVYFDIRRELAEVAAREAPVAKQQEAPALLRMGTKTGARTVLAEFDDLMSAKPRIRAAAGFNDAYWIYHPLEWALEHAHEYPKLTPYIIDVFMTPIDSLELERWFSATHRLLAPSRHSISTRNLAAQALLNRNLQMALDLRFGRDVYKLNSDTKQHALDALFTRVQREGKVWKDYLADIPGAGEEPEEAVAEAPEEAPGWSDGEGPTEQGPPAGVEGRWPTPEWNTEVVGGDGESDSAF